VTTCWCWPSCLRSSPTRSCSSAAQAAAAARAAGLRPFGVEPRVERRAPTGHASLRRTRLSVGRVQAGEHGEVSDIAGE
jgi:hypothetical protein